MADEPQVTAARAPLALAGAVSAPAPDGLEASAHYGDPAGEYRRLLEECGLVDRWWAEHLELRGEDRLRFLDGLVTCAVKTLVPGDGRFGLFTSAQGRVLAEVRIEARGEALLLELPAGCATPIAEHLSRYVVTDRVEIETRPELWALSLVGPGAVRVAERLRAGGLGEPGAPRWSHRQAVWRGRELTIAREERLGGPALTLRVAEQDAYELASELTLAGQGTAAVPVGFAAAEALRVEAGLARFGPDFGSERFPQEVDAGEALDFEKGCYLGQEVVARIHYRGKVNHRLCGLRLGDAEPPAAGGGVELAGEEVGRAGTAVRSPRLGETIALAVVHRRAEAGAAVRVGGANAELVDLPFASG